MIVVCICMVVGSWLGGTPGLVIGGLVGLVLDDILRTGGDHL